MNSIKVKSGQTLPDIAIQYCDALSAWPDIAKMNGLALTSALTAGQSLVVPDPIDKRVVSYFNSGAYFPAAGEVPSYGDGIGYWIIESDFIVQ